MEAQTQKGLLIRLVGLGLVSSLILLFPASFQPSTSAQMMAYPLIPIVVWSEGYHAVEDIAYGLAIDSRGAAVVVGTSGVIKYAPDGRKLWQVEYPGVAYGVTTDSLADIVVAGSDGLIKLDSEGRQLWAVAGEFYKVTAAAGDLVVAVGPAGVGIYTPSGEVAGELAYPGVPHGVAGSGERVVVVGTAGIAAYSLQSRDRLWQIPYQGELRGVALDSEGNVIVVGSIGVAKYSPSGRLIWREPFLGEPQAVAILPTKEPSREDEIIVTGGYKGGDDWDYRTVKYSSEGKELWDIRYDGGHGDDIAYAVAVSPSGQVYVTGASTLAKGISAAADKDYYTIQYDERPLPEALEARDEDHQRSCPPEGLPRAAFTVANPAPLTGEAIPFANHSFDPDGYLIAWSWAFGDGSSSAEWEPAHSYSRKGHYTVVLTVVDDSFCIATAEGSVEVGNRPPEADFTWTPLEPTDLEEALFIPEFEDLDGEITLVRWELGDGMVVEWESEWEFGPPGRRNTLSYQYPDDGLYTVRLIVVDDDGAETEVIKEITVLNVPPEASFTFEAEPGGGELRADFTWTVDRERHGRYPAGFVPEGPTDLDEIIFEDHSTAGTGLGLFHFSGEAIDPDGRVVSWHWAFGDGTTASEPNPSHQYQEAGTYHVTLTVTDDDSDSTTSEADVEVGEVGGAIVAWEWSGSEIFPQVAPGPEGPPREYRCSFSSNEQDPTVWFEDDCYIEVTLTVWDATGNSAFITKGIQILNVPPVADFSWGFEQPGDLLPSCLDVFPEPGPEFACQEPALEEPIGKEGRVPRDVGVVAFSDLSVDSESWPGHEVNEWLWNFGDLGWICWEGDECLRAQNPKVLFLDENNEFLFHGDREVWLSVRDDDDEGGDLFESSYLSKTVTIANIPPYAAFEWQDWGNWSELVFPVCMKYLQCIVPKPPPSDYLCIDHEVAGYPGCGGIFAPWAWEVEAKVGINSTEDTVEITETIPNGWGYWLTEYEGACVTITDQGTGYWKATIEPANCLTPYSTEIKYYLYPPYEGPLGQYEIETTAVHDGSLETFYTPVELQAQVVAYQSLQLHGYGSEVYFIDPNGDELISWEWQGLPFGAIVSGQDPTGGDCNGGWCEFTLGDPMIGLRCEFDPERWGWFWSRDLAVSLTVTDALGASTTVTETIHLEGPCGEMPA